MVYYILSQSRWLRRLNGFLRTSPPLSLSAMILGCVDNLIMQSAGKSIPVFAGTLYRITGIGELSATWREIKLSMTSSATPRRVYHWRGRGRQFSFKVLFFNHACTVLKLIYLGKVLLQSFRCHAILVETRSHNKCCVSTCLGHFICYFYGVPCSFM